MPKNVYKYIAFPIIATLFVGALFLSQTNENTGNKDEDAEILNATINHILKEQTIEDGEIFIQKLEVEITKGDKIGKVIIIENDESHQVNRRIFEEGDKVILNYNIGQNTQSLHYDLRMLITKIEHKIP